LLPVRIFPPDQIRQTLHFPDLVPLMRNALIAHSTGECDTPMPMHLDIPPGAEVHIKSSYRRGGRYFALKIAATFPANTARDLPVGNGMMLLSSAGTGEPLAFLADGGHLTDVRTAAVAAMTACELGRRDTALGILGTGIQARLCARMFGEILRPSAIAIWGRSRAAAAACARDLRTLLPGSCKLDLAAQPEEVARECRLIVTCTAARQPLLPDHSIQPGTHVCAIGADSPGKQELDPATLRRASLVLADSRAQCEKLGELQHTPDLWGRAVEIGEFCRRPRSIPKDAITVADFTGLGVEDLYIAEYVYERLLARA
jgi:ornithine cyclodeaminase